MNNPIEIELVINASIATVWQCLTESKHIVHWNFAHESWHCPSAQCNVRIGGHFNYRMEAKDGSFGFDYEGTFDQIETESLLHYHLGNGRQVRIQLFQLDNHQTKFYELFEPETQQDIEMQRQGWLAIAEHLRNYAESLSVT